MPFITSPENLAASAALRLGKSVAGATGDAPNAAPAESQSLMKMAALGIGVLALVMYLTKRK